MSKESTDRLPPYSEEAEKALIGCILLSQVGERNAVLDDCLERGIGAEWFYDLRHQLIFSKAMQMHKARVAVDIITLQQQLRDEGNIERVGDLAYLLECQNTPPSDTFFDNYATTLRAKFLARKLLAKCAETAQAIYAAEDVDALVSQTALDFMGITETAATQQAEQHIKEAVRKVVADMEEHYTRGKLNLPPGYLSTGYEYMDKVTGGIGPDELVILAGRPGSGKTTIAMDLVWNLSTVVKWTEKTGADAEGHAEWTVRDGKLPIGIFSLEMSEKSLARRLMFRCAQVSSGKFKQGFATGSDIDKLTVAAGQVSEQNIILDATPGQTIGQIAAKARRWVKKYGIKLFVLDYLQLVGVGKRMENRNRELEEIVNQIVVLKKALGVPWVVLTQMNRDIEKAESHRVPQLADLKDCGAIEQACDHAFFLYQPERGKTRIDKNGDSWPDKRQQEDEFIREFFAGLEESEMPRRINGFEAKNRDGATGIVEFLFHRNQFRFEDWRNFATANGFKEYGKGERRANNPSEPKISDEDVPR